MKRLIVCCDGTWQSHNNQIPTNVLKIAQAVKPKDEDGISQILYYDQGIGAVPDYEPKISNKKKQLFLKGIVDRLQKIGGGAFGWWIDEKIEEAYIFLCLNYEPDDEIYLFGFSRGAYTVRSLAGLISCCGLLKRPHISKTNAAYDIYRNKKKVERKTQGDSLRKNEELTQPHESVRIKFLGCWDTVGALGIPDLLPRVSIDRIFGRKYKFHDNKLSSIIENARHAIAIDEKRSTFKVTMMKPGDGFKKENLKQVWFPGDHGCVGGGTDKMIKLSDDCELKALNLSKAALDWMAEQASDLGLDLDLKLAKNVDLNFLNLNQNGENNTRQNQNVEENNFSQNFIIKMMGSVIKKIGKKERNIHQLCKLELEEKNNSSQKFLTQIIGSVVEIDIKEGDLKRSCNLDEDFNDRIIALWCHQNYRPKNLPKYIKEDLKKHCPPT